jgi:glycosyltransferase involved in cell wall biosynthesis
MTSATIVIPCYNEAERLDVARFGDYLANRDGPRLLMVNDGSSDGTLMLLRRLAVDYPGRCEVINLHENSGKAEAVRQGVLAALDSGAASVGYWDADLATPLEAIDQFCSVLDRRSDVDWVVGTRLPLLGRSIQRRPVRNALGRMFARVASVALGVRIVDTQCGAKLFRATPLTKAAFGEPFCTRWIFDVEIFARLIRHSGSSAAIAERTYELPLDAWSEVPGSKLRSSDFVAAARELAGIYLRYLRPALPKPAALPDVGAVSAPASGDRSIETRKAG